MSKHNLYTIDVDMGRNYYSCGAFGHLARNCKNQKIVEEWRKV